MNNQTYKKKRNIPAIIAIIIGIVVVSLYVIFMNAFMGNPISANRAEKQITQYVADKYPYMNLTLSKAEFNYRIPGYTVVVKQEGTSEVIFQITRRNDGVIMEDYKN